MIPSRLPRDRRGPTGRNMQALDALQVDVRGVEAMARGEAHVAAAVVGAYAYLVARYSRDDIVTIGLSAVMQAALGAAVPTSPVSPSWCRLDLSDAGTLAEVADALRDAVRRCAAIVSSGGVPAGVVFAGADEGDDHCGGEIVVRVGVTRQSATIRVSYDASRFDPQVVTGFRDAGATLLAAVCHEPARPIDTVELVSSDEHGRMQQWQGAEVTWPGSALVHERIAEQAARTPSAVAVEMADETLTYAELSRRVGSLALALRQRGVEPGHIVAVCIARSVEMVVAILAIHAAGGAFLPVDPDLPVERVRHKLTDCDCTLMLTHPPLMARAQAFSAAAGVLDVTTVGVRAEATMRDAWAPDRTAEAQLAYVMYTSGSTGVPKGVEIPHRALSNHAQWFAAFVGMTNADRVLQIASLSFDASLAELFAPLCVGATIVLAPRQAHRDLLGIADLAASLRITVMQQVPSALRIIVGTPGFARLSTLRYLVSGGEGLDGALAAQILERLPQVRLGNCYGPTEATVDALAFEVPRTLPADGAVPIGTPIANGRAYILDAHGAPVPVGMPGELYLGGRGLADGYRRLPDRTVFRFVVDRWRTGERLYRTGDVARYRADGLVECLGRVDTQVKLRGYRIEPAEIETAILQDPAVREAVVVLRTDRPEDPQLAAYVVPQTGMDVTADSVRARVRATCPAWMVPASVCVMDALPVLASGKIDRNALPAPNAFVEAGNDTGEGDSSLESSLIAIWQQVLGVRPIRPDDDFFALGGHSVTAIRLLAAIEREHGMALRAATLFEAPSVRALAARMREQRPATVSTVVRVQPHGSRTPLFLAPGGGGELFIFEALARALGPDQPLYLLDMYVFDEIALPTATVTLADVAARMLVDIRAVQPHGPYQLAGYSLGGNIAMEIAQQLRQAGDEVALLALLDCDGPNYPVLQPLPQRIVTHLRHAFTLSPDDRAAYVRHRLRAAMQRVLPPAPGPSLYSDQPDVHLVPAHVLQSLERALQPVLRAWEAYVPAPYAGRTLIVRADIRRPMIGVIDDDPWLGWKPVLTGEVVLDRLPCDHFAMFHTANAPEFVAMFGKYLREGAVGAAAHET